MKKLATYNLDELTINYLQSLGGNASELIDELVASFAALDGHETIINARFGMRAKMQEAALKLSDEDESKEKIVMSYLDENEYLMKGVATKSLTRTVNEISNKISFDKGIDISNRVIKCAVLKRYKQKV
jgi:hypothetical protein